MTMYCAQRLSVRIDSKIILENLDAEFQSGEFCAILGPNGAGKTSLLRALTGDLPLLDGSVRFAGRDLHEWPIRDIARVRGVLPQISSLDFPFTVRDVIEMGRFPHRSTKVYNRQVVEETAEKCDCAHLLDRSFLHLSGGEQQRVQIARVLAQIWDDDAAGPRFLLLDEPVSALDLSHQYRIMQMLYELTRKRDIGVVCVLHNLNLAAQSVNRCLILDEGRLIADGKPSEVFTEETISNVFDIDIWIRQHPENPEIPYLIPKLEGQAGQKKSSLL
ncbi:MAG: heme ABC transporter ATP-binding protein [Gammaproteobacteria bacterium]|nr:heme ABC transporter ATP-binding protein [Gammaproteobacteria bacterium]MYD75949.1 heme ABC transporter ATP-binding protein [Gammaproteobacteria bacterium]